MKTTSIVFIFIFGFIRITSAINQPLPNSNSEEFVVIIENGKKGLKNAKGKIVIPAKYENIGWSNGTEVPVNGVIGFQKNGLWGIVSVSNKVVATAEYVKLSSNKSNEYIIAAKSELLSNTQLFGVLNAKGKEVIPFNYYVLVEVEGNLITAVKQNNEVIYGLINFNSKELLPIKYQNIYPISSKLLALHRTDGYIDLYRLDRKKLALEGLTKFELWDSNFMVYEGLKCGLVDDEGITLAPIEYKELRWKDDQLQGLKYSHWIVCTGDNQMINEVDCDDIVFKKDNAVLIGPNNQMVVDRDGNSFTSAGYLEAIDNVVGRQVVFKEEDKYGIYDGVKQQIVKRNVDSLWFDGEFYYAMMMNENRKQWTILDTFQIKRNKYDYDVVKPQQNRMFAVKRNGYWGFIVRNGYEIIPCKYDSVGKFVVNDVVARIGGKEGILSISGRWSVKLRKAKIELLSPLYFLSREEGKTNLEKVSGGLVYSTDNTLKFINGVLWEYRKDSTIVKMNLQGKVISAPYSFSSSIYEGTKYIYDDWIAVKLNEKFGFFDTKMGILRIANRYEDVGSANIGDLITIKILGKWGAINRNEDIVVQPNYDSIYTFDDGMMITRTNDRYGLINEKGRIILRNRYELIQRQENGRYITKEDDKYGLIDKDGKVIITHKYDSLQDTSNGYVIISVGEKFGVVTLDGLNTVPQVYDNVRYNPESDLYFAEIKGGWEKID